MAEISANPATPGVPWETAVRCHPGRLREINEDAYLARPDLGLWAVADGMGGHAAGDLASRTVVSWLDRIQPTRDLEGLVQAVERAVAEAHGAIRAESITRNHETIGSTVAVLAAHSRRCTVLWAGDSRVYLYRAHALRRLSRDHSVAQERISQGDLPASQAEDSPDANVLTRAVGMEGDLALDRISLPVRPGDVFLLCSDGLNKELTDDELQSILSAPQSLDTLAQRMLEQSLVRGGRDNITLILVRYLDTGR